MGIAEGDEHCHSEFASLQLQNGQLIDTCGHQKAARKAYCKGHQQRSSGPALLRRTFVDKPSSWGTEPQIVLANKSAYRVSYWVAQEDKKKTTTARQKEQVVTYIDLQLNTSSVGDQTGAAANRMSGGVKGSTSTTTRTTEGPSPSPPPSSADDLDEGVYFLTRDHRMGPMGITQATRVPFPVDCQDMRVYAFFELDGLWRLYEDKVYSIGLFKKVFTLTSCDGNISPHIDRTSSEATLVPGTPF